MLVVWIILAPLTVNVIAPESFESPWLTPHKLSDSGLTTVTGMPASLMWTRDPHFQIPACVCVGYTHPTPWSLVAGLVYPSPLVYDFQELSEWRGRPGVIQQAVLGQVLPIGCVELFNEISERAEKRDRFHP